MDKNKEKSFGIIFIVLTLLIFSMMVGYYFSVPWLAKNIKAENNFGVFGDMFGAINALFTALAFAAAITTLYMQREELKLQREELAEQRKEMARQREEMEESNKISLKQIELFSAQSKLMDKQCELIQSDITLKHYTDLIKSLEERIEFHHRSGNYIGGKPEDLIMKLHAEILKIQSPTTKSRVTMYFKTKFSFWIDQYNLVELK